MLQADGDATITKLEEQNSEHWKHSNPTHVSYTYSEKTYDGQTDIRNGYGVFNDWTDTTSDHLPEYKEAYF